MTVVLLHGSTQNASCWDLVRREMPDSVAIDLPADRPDFTATDFAKFVADRIDDDVVIVAHSASGMFLPIIAQLRRVRALVYLAAMIPAVGRSGLAQYQQEPDMLAPDWVAAGRDWADSAKWRALADRFLFHDVDAADLEQARASLRVMRTDGMLRETFKGSTITPVRSLCVVCTADRTINPRWQERVWRERTNQPLAQIGCGHSPHIARSRETAALIRSVFTH